MRRQKNGALSEISANNAPQTILVLLPGFHTKCNGVEFGDKYEKFARAVGMISVA